MRAIVKLKKIARRAGLCAVALFGMAPFGAAMAGEAAEPPADAELREALIAEGMPAKAEIVVDRGHLYLGTALLETVRYQPATGRFAARVAGGREAITGAVLSRDALPTLIRPVARGEVIAADMIEIVDVERRGRGVRGLIEDADALIGMEARRPLRAHAPIRAVDVAAPILVERGADVRLVFRVGALSMSHQGVAETDGAEGDIISVRNVASERIVKGRVAGRNLIETAASGGVAGGR